jgi:hypothetical protein
MKPPNPSFALLAFFYFLLMPDGQSQEAQPKNTNAPVVHYVHGKNSISKPVHDWLQQEKASGILVITGPRRLFDGDSVELIKQWVRRGGCLQMGLNQAGLSKDAQKDFFGQEFGIQSKLLVAGAVSVPKEAAEHPLNRGVLRVKWMPIDTVFMQKQTPIFFGKELKTIIKMRDRYDNGILVPEGAVLGVQQFGNGRIICWSPFEEGTEDGFRLLKNIWLWSAGLDIPAAGKIELPSK